MQKILLTVAAVCSFSIGTIESTYALVPAGPSVAPSADARSDVQDTRLYCYNRYSGRFLHWGACGGYRRHYYYRPRVYCRNTYTGQFLHWGSCW